MFGNRTARAQSAMEYLMTYGWAILIIAVVLAALFSLGVFSGGNLLGNSCVASPGYECTTATLAPGTGTVGLTSVDYLSLNLGQNTGSSINNVELACSATVTSNGYPSVSSSNVASLGGAGYNVMMTGTGMGFANVLSTGAVTNAVSGLNMQSGQTASITMLPCFGSTGYLLTTGSSPIGTSFSGYLFINYTTSSASPGASNPYFTLKVATITLKVV